MKPCLPLVAVSLLFALTLVAIAQAADAPVIPTVNDAAILRNLPGANYKFPSRLYTPEMIALLKSRKYYVPFAVWAGNGSRADQLWRQIPEDRWAAMIPPYAPGSASGAARGALPGLCPFCGKTYAASVMTPEELVKSPLVAHTGCCGHAIYEREEDMPADYAARPNHTEPIPHLDGTTYNYRFYCPPGTEAAPIGIGTGRAQWFSSAGEVWRARMRLLVTMVVPDLLAQVFHREDPAAARQLAVILDRLADVYPGLPLYTADQGHGFALGPDAKSYLTREQYLALPRPSPYDMPFYYRGYNYDKLNHGISSWQDGVMAQCGDFAEAFDLIRDYPAVKAFSQEKYGDPGAWEKRVRERVMEEMGRMCSAVRDTRGNTINLWITGGLRLGLVLQDDYFASHALAQLEKYIPNGYFSDGLCEEGAFNYASMMGPLISSMWMLEEFGGIKPKERYPLLNVIERGQWPVISLYGVESMHADEHAFFFSGAQLPWRVPPEKLDYAKHEVAQCYPEYGLTCLRAGAPGSRLETILDYQSAVGHTHYARLNLQLFYEGVNVLPDLGYAPGVVDITKEPWKDLKYPFELMPIPNPEDWWGAWHYMYTVQPEAHCTGTVDTNQYKDGPATFQRFLGGAGLSDPAYGVQFIEVDGRGLYYPKHDPTRTGIGSRVLYSRVPDPVPVFDRQLVTLTLPGGRSAAVDVFRMSGGRRHDLFWHVPAPDPETSLGEPQAVRAANLREYWTAQQAPAPEQQPGATFLRKLAEWPAPATMWNATWSIDPSQFYPRTEGGRKIYQPWMDVLHPVKLRLWGTQTGGPAQSNALVRARGPWPSNLWEVKADGTDARGIVAFADALSYLDEYRQSTEPGLESTFVHVLEPFNPGQQPPLSQVVTLAAEAGSSPTAVGLRLSVAAGAETPSQPVLVATTLDGGTFRGGGMTLEGRLGVVVPQSGALTLYDGSRLAARGWQVDLASPLRLKLLGVIGDLTGSPMESALIVACDEDPSARFLAGRMLTVQHQISFLHTSGYTIEKVSAYGPGRWRIDLRDGPPFLQHQMTVRALQEGNPRILYADFQLYKGQSRGLYTGRRIRFPRTGLDLPIQDTPTSVSNWHSDIVELAADPPAGAIHVGDPFVIYTIQPGDEVLLPSHFASQAEKGPEGLRLELVATGPLRLQVPAPYRRAALISGETSTPLPVTALPAGGLVLQLGAGQLTAGRATLLLNP